MTAGIEKLIATVQEAICTPETSLAVILRALGIRAYFVGISNCPGTAKAQLSVIGYSVTISEEDLTTSPDTFLDKIYDVLLGLAYRLAQEVPEQNGGPFLILENDIRIFLNKVGCEIEIGAWTHRQHLPQQEPVEVPADLSKSIMEQIDQINAALPGGQ